MMFFLDLSKLKAPAPVKKQGATKQQPKQQSKQRPEQQPKQQKDKGVTLNSLRDLGKVVKPQNTQKNVQSKQRKKNVQNKPAQQPKQSAKQNVKQNVEHPNNEVQGFKGLYTDKVYTGTLFMTKVQDGKFIAGVITFEEGENSYMVGTGVNACLAELPNINAAINEGKIMLQVQFRVNSVDKNLLASHVVVMQDSSVQELYNKVEKKLSNMEAHVVSVPSFMQQVVQLDDGTEDLDTILDTLDVLGGVFREGKLLKIILGS